MLKNFVKAVPPEEEELKKELHEQRDALAAYQMKIKEAQLPVMVIFEGWGAAGKGSTVGKVIKNIDPRFFRVIPMAPPTATDKRYPFLYRYLLEIPEAGKFTFFDTYWMEEVTNGVLSGEYDEETYKRRINSINTAERSLHDNGYLIVKFFFQISRKEQKKRLDALAADKDTSWRVSDRDLLQNRNYKKTMDVFDRYLEDTNRSVAPWYIIDAKDRKWAELQVLRFLNQSIDTALKNKALAAPILQNIFPLEPIPKLADIELKGIAGTGALTLDDALEISFADGLMTVRFLNEAVAAGRPQRQVPMDTLSDLRVIVDTSAIEIYANDGAEVFSTRWFPEGDALSVRSTFATQAANVWPLENALANAFD